MLENGKMWLLRCVFEAIFGHNVINRHFLKGILGCFFGVIRGCLWRLFSGCKLFNYPSPADKSATSPARGEVLNNITLKDLNVVRQYAALFERRVQSSTRVRKAQAVTRQTKHIRNLLPQCASDATGFLSDVYKKSTRARKFLADGVQYGRSMIEMLGVLAIIGVLSVAGIAGYSKAMEMWRVNKTVEEYKYVIHSLMEHLPELQKLNSSDSQYMLTDFILDANMVPSTWSRRGTDLSDSFGGATAIFIRRNHLSVEIYHHFPYASGASLSSVEFCKTMIKDIAQPLASAMYGVGLYLFEYDDDIIYGDAYCGSGKICLHNLTVSEINKICHSYKKGERYSSVILYF